MEKRPAASGIWLPLICLLCISATSCKKFLEAYSQNNSFVETTADLNELLVGDAYYPARHNWPLYPFVMDDDTELGKPETISRMPLVNASFHHWQANPRIDSEGALNNTDPVFTNLYKWIARINSILHNVELLRDKGQPAAELNRIAGEAHFLRAWYYFTLVNLYGKPYRVASAATDFGVPLKTDPLVKEQFATRSNAKQVYDQIVADLLDAEKELEGANLNSRIRANQAAAQSLLSRVYLFMEEYEKSLQYANKVIGSNQYQLSDLNHHTVGNDFLLRNSPEVVFTMKETLISTLMSTSSDNPGTEYYIASGDLVGSYDPNDLRLQAFFRQNSKGEWKLVKKSSFNYSIDDVSDMFLLRIAEQYLNKAEALAALDRFPEARNTLQELLKKRFKPEDIDQVTADGAALIQFIRDERRRELCFETHRWFDLRRYAVNAKYPFSKSIRHRSFVFSGNGFIENGYYELGPYDQDQAAYIVPIANDEIEFNQGRLANEPRPVRPLKQ